MLQVVEDVPSVFSLPASNWLDLVLQMMLQVVEDVPITSNHTIGSSSKLQMMLQVVEDVPYIYWGWCDAIRLVTNDASSCWRCSYFIWRSRAISYPGYKWCFKVLKMFLRIIPERFWFPYSYKWCFKLLKMFPGRYFITLGVGKTVTNDASSCWRCSC